MAGPQVARRFIGRTYELGRLEAALRQASEGLPAMVVVGGEAGVGKSWLVDEFATRARATGARVLVGRCLDLGLGGYPYAPFIESFRSLLRDTDPALLPALLGPGRLELSRLLPELAPHMGSRIDPPTEPSRLARTRLFELILGLVERLTSGQVLVVILEDLQWSDDSSRELLGFLARTVRRGRVLLIGTVRSDELGERPQLLRLLAELERDERLERIELSRFDRAELAELVAAGLGRAPDRGLLDRLMERTDGNPFFAQQLLAASREGAGDDLPVRLRDVIRARVASLSAGARTMLRIASVGGVQVDDRLLAAVTAMPIGGVQSALREALERGLLVSNRGDNGGGVGFSHGLVQEAVYADLLPGERIQWHTAFGDALEADPGLAGSPRAATAQLARHWDAAGNRARALPAALAAAGSAAEMYAFAEADRHYQRALELIATLPASEVRDQVDIGDVLHQAAEMSALLGRYARAIELNRAALARADAAADPARQALLHERLRWYLWESGDYAAAVEAVEQAARLVPSDRPSAGRSRILCDLAGVLMYQGRYEESRDIADEALQMARAVGGLPEAAMALGVLGWDVAALHEPAVGLGHVREALEIAKLLGRPEGTALGLTNLSALLDFLGRPAEALEEAERGIAVVRGLGLERTYGTTLKANAASALFTMGRWDEARALAVEAVEGDLSGADSAWVNLTAGRIEAASGDFDAARQHLATSLRLADQPAARRYRAQLFAAIAELELSQGHFDDVRAALETGRSSEIGDSLDVSELPLSTVAIRAEADRAERARAARDEAEVEAAVSEGGVWLEWLRRMSAAERASGYLDARVEAAISLGEAEGSRLGGESDSGLWEKAVSEFDAAGVSYTAAYARYRQAEATIGRRQGRAEAEAVLAMAHQTARRLGAHPLTREIEVLARQARLTLATPNAAAAKPAREAEPLSHAERLGLTSREQEVLSLLTLGKTNREIAETLFISPKTASAHVSNILSKLGASGRTEAAGIAHRLGLVVEPVVERVGSAVSGRS